MAVKLLPPIIEGKIPAQFGDEFRIPFVHNRAVGKGAYDSFNLKIKTVSTGKQIGILNSNQEAENFVVFTKNEHDNINLTPGQYYKIQMAYVKGLEVGYYSTVGIFKYTTKPEIYIIDETSQPLQTSTINPNSSIYTGIYKQTGEEYLDPVLVNNAINLIITQRQNQIDAFDSILGGKTFEDLKKDKEAEKEKPEEEKGINSSRADILKGIIENINLAIEVFENKIKEYTEEYGTQEFKNFLDELSVEFTSLSDYLVHFNDEERDKLLQAYEITAEELEQATLELLYLLDEYKADEIFSDEEIKKIQEALTENSQTNLTIHQDHYAQEGAILNKLSVVEDLVIKLKNLVDNAKEKTELEATKTKIDAIVKNLKEIYSNINTQSEKFLNEDGTEKQLTEEEIKAIEEELKKIVNSLTTEKDNIVKAFPDASSGEYQDILEILNNSIEEINNQLNAKDEDKKYLEALSKVLVDLSPLSEGTQITDYYYIYIYEPLNSFKDQFNTFYDNFMSEENTTISKIRSILEPIVQKFEEYNSIYNYNLLIQQRDELIRYLQDTLENDEGAKETEENIWTDLSNLNTGINNYIEPYKDALEEFSKATKEAEKYYFINSDGTLVAKLTENTDAIAVKNSYDEAFSALKDKQNDIIKNYASFKELYSPINHLKLYYLNQNLNNILSKLLENVSKCQEEIDEIDIYIEYLDGLNNDISSINDKNKNIEKLKNHFIPENGKIPVEKLDGLDFNKLLLFNESSYFTKDKLSKVNYDTSEKVYSYCFNLYKGNKLIETSGEIIHDASKDSEIDSSFDSYSLTTNLEYNTHYTLQYVITTGNNLKVNSPLYHIQRWGEIPNPLSRIAAVEIPTEYNNEEEYIKNKEEGYFTVGLRFKDKSNICGQFKILRASSLDNYSTWDLMSSLKIDEMVQENSYYPLFKDFTIQQGVKYKYGIQQYYNNLVTEILETDEFLCDFEYTFLYDGERQLKIKFDPKVSSLKNTILETKQDTIGGKHPIFYRNAKVNYKELPISGLISYLMDDNELFLTNEEIQLASFEPERYSTVSEEESLKGVRTINLTSENILSERLFKLKVLDWLTNGQPKIFRSPTEGNYVVRLMNTSLSPNDTLGRMLHTFSCTAYEIADFTYDNLKYYNFISSEEINKNNILHTYSIDLAGKKKNSIINFNSSEFSKLTELNPGDRFNLLFDDGTSLDITIGLTGKYNIDKQGLKKITILSDEIIEGSLEIHCRKNDNFYIPYNINKDSYYIESITSEDRCEQFIGSTDSDSEGVEIIKQLISPQESNDDNQMVIYELDSIQFLRIEAMPINISNTSQKIDNIVLYPTDEQLANGEEEYINGLLESYWLEGFSPKDNQNKKIYSILDHAIIDGKPYEIPTRLPSGHIEFKVSDFGVDKFKPSALYIKEGTYVDIYYRLNKYVIRKYLDNGIKQTEEAQYYVL